MASTGKFTVKPVGITNWNDFEELFETKGAPGYCWCMAWRMTKEELKDNNSASRKKFIKRRILSRTPIGLLGYMDKEVIAWCSIAPRESYVRLGGDEELQDVWSIACFFIKRPYRDQGLVDKLIEEARNYARKKGAKYLEAYPVLPSSPSYRFMGFVHSFEKANFSFVKKAGTRRHVMTYKL